MLSLYKYIQIFINIKNVFIIFLFLIFTTATRFISTDIYAHYGTFGYLVTHSIDVFLCVRSFLNEFTSGAWNKQKIIFSFHSIRFVIIRDVLCTCSVHPGKKTEETFPKKIYKNIKLRHFPRDVSQVFFSYIHYLTYILLFIR